MIMDCIKKQTYKYARQKLNLFNKTWGTESTDRHIGHGVRTDNLSSGYGQTDTILESSYGNMSAHKKFQLKIKS